MIFLCIFCIIIWVSPGSQIENTIFDMDSHESRLFEVGRSQYNKLAEKGSLPVYGACWKSAVSNLHSGCKHLNENIQSDIALRFTDCFLIMSGHRPYKCQTKENVKNDCLTGMSDRAFNAYTEFYTHTQDICFYLQSQIWREETEKSIDKLSKTSSQVTEQLEYAKEHAEEIQAVLQEHQKESMSIQRQLLGNGESLNEILLNSQTSVHEMMSEFRLATLEQKKMLFDVFERLSSLQSWAIGEISWLDSVIFYFISSVIAYVITATPRTQGARLLIFLVLSLNVCIERTVCTYLLQDNYSEINTFNENLHWWIWFCRKVLMGICGTILAFCIYTYCDYNVVNHELLLEIQKQNSQLLNQMKLLDTSFSLSPIQKLSHNYDQITTTNSTGIAFCSTPVIKNTGHVDSVISPTKEPNPVNLISVSNDEPDYSHLKSYSPSPSVSSKTSVSTNSRITRRGDVCRRTIIEISSVTNPYNLRSFDKTNRKIDNHIDKAISVLK